MIKIRDWVASIPPEDKHIAYVGEGEAQQREFLLTGDDWKTYKDWSFHLDMAFDLSTVTVKETREVETTLETESGEFTENEADTTSETRTDTSTETANSTSNRTESMDTFKKETSTATGTTTETITEAQNKTQVNDQGTVTTTSESESTLTDATQSSVTVKTNGTSESQADNLTQGQNSRTASTTKEKRTITEVTVNCQSTTDVAALDKKVTAEGLVLTWTVLRQQTQLPGRLRATLRAVGTAGQVKKSGIMVFEVEPAVIAEPAAVVPVSEFEAMEQRLVFLLGEANTHLIAANESAIIARSAETGANSATSSAKNYAAEAKNSMVEAREHAASTATDAEQAASSAERAASSAKQVAQYVTNASGALTEAWVAANVAQEHAGTAESASAQAALSAQAAAESATHTGELMKDTQRLQMTAASAAMAAIEAAESASSLINDIAIGEASTWSSQNILERLCPKIDEIAPAVACYPLEGTELTAHIQYAADAEVKTFYFGGKNLLCYPYEGGETTTINGITFTNNGDGSVTLNGTAPETAGVLFALSSVTVPTLVPKGATLTLSGCPEGGSGSRYYIGAKDVITNTQYTADVGKGSVFVAESPHIRVYIGVAKGVTVENLTFWPQLEVGDTVTDYALWSCQKRTDAYENGAVYKAVARTGQNTLFVSDGTVEVSGWEDPTEILKQVQAAVKALK